MTFEYVYLFRCGDHYKIGRSRNLSRRLRQLDSGPTPVDRVHVIPSVDSGLLEKVMHRAFDDVRVRGEWFALTPKQVAEIVALQAHATDADIPEHWRGQNAVCEGDEPSPETCPHPTRIGLLVRTLRTDAGWSQSVLAKKAGLSQAYIAQMEAGDRLPGDEVTERLAHTLGVMSRQLRLAMPEDSAAHLHESCFLPVIGYINAH